MLRIQVTNTDSTSREQDITSWMPVQVQCAVCVGTDQLAQHEPVRTCPHHRVEWSWTQCWGCLPYRICTPRAGHAQLDTELSLPEHLQGTDKTPHTAQQKGHTVISDSTIQEKGHVLPLTASGDSTKFLTFPFFVKNNILRRNY